MAKFTHGTQTDRERATNGPDEGHRQTGRETQTDRDRDTSDGKGTQMGTVRDTDTIWTTVTDNLQKNKSIENVQFEKILQNRI